MLATIRSSIVVGIEALAVSIEVRISKGHPSMSISEIAASEYRAVRNRIQAAFRSCGFAFSSNESITCTVKVPETVRRITTRLTVSGMANIRFF